MTFKGNESGTNSVKDGGDDNKNTLDKIHDEEESDDDSVVFLGVKMIPKTRAQKRMNDSIKVNKNHDNQYCDIRRNHGNSNVDENERVVEDDEDKDRDKGESENVRKDRPATLSLTLHRTQQCVVVPSSARNTSHDIEIYKGVQEDKETQNYLSCDGLLRITNQAREIVDTKLELEVLNKITDLQHIGWIQHARNKRIYFPGILHQSDDSLSKMFLENETTGKIRSNNPLLMVQFIGFGWKHSLEYELICSSRWVSYADITDHQNKEKLSAHLKCISKLTTFKNNLLALKTEELAIEKMWTEVRVRQIRDKHNHHALKQSADNNHASSHRHQPKNQTPHQMDSVCFGTKRRAQDEHSKVDGHGSVRHKKKQKQIKSGSMNTTIPSLQQSLAGNHASSRRRRLKTRTPHQMNAHTDNCNNKDDNQDHIRTSNADYGVSSRIMGVVNTVALSVPNELFDEKGRTRNDTASAEAVAMAASSNPDSYFSISSSDQKKKEKGTNTHKDSSDGDDIEIFGTKLDPIYIDVDTLYSNGVEKESQENLLVSGVDNGNDVGDGCEDDDIIITKETGMNPFRDLPHQRYLCNVKPFKSGKDAADFCPNCYCYVCDIKASECTEWKGSHCQAVSSDIKWRRRHDSNLKKKNRPQRACHNQTVTIR